MSTLKVDNLLNSAGNESPISVPGAAKAWVNFNGTVSSNFIRDSYNVSAITDEATAGHYTVTFTNNMSNTNYCVVASTDFDQAYAGDVIIVNQTTSTFKLKNHYGSGHAGTDTSLIMAVVFGD